MCRIGVRPYAIDGEAPSERADQCRTVGRHDRVLLTYQARTAATDDEARRGVQRYWRVLSPFIGLVLRGVLRAIRRHAETSR